MNTHRRIRESRRLVVTAALIGYLLAVAVPILILAVGDGATPGIHWTIPAWMVILATPATWAMLSLDRRPSLLRASVYAAVALTVLHVAGGLFAPVLLLLAIAWVIAGRRRPIPVTQPAGAAWRRAVMVAVMVAGVSVMYLHLDPMCTVQSPDGAVATVPDEQARAGWHLGFASSSVSESSFDESGVTTTCWSDTVQWWEGVAGLVVASVALGLGWRWPMNGDTRSGLSETTRAGAMGQ